MKKKIILIVSIGLILSLFILVVFLKANTCVDCDGDIVEPVYTQDCFPRTLKENGVTEDCFEKANFGDDTSCSSSEIEMIKEYYKNGQDKDLLNDGSGRFCAN